MKFKNIKTKIQTSLSSNFFLFKQSINIHNQNMKIRSANAAINTMPAKNPNNIQPTYKNSFWLNINFCPNGKE